MTLMTLYKKASSGKISRWSVMTSDNQVISRFGYIDGKQQETIDVIKGKNLGKKNETTAQQQADVRAEQLWGKKIKSGYVTDKSGETELPSIIPMLAFPIEKKEKYVKFPSIIQPKLDGMRCIAVVKNGKAKLYTRTRKEITTLPHIVEAIEKQCNEKTNIILDGEIYNHTLRDDFNKIISLVKRNQVHEESELIQYHIYDAVSDLDYIERIEPACRICLRSEYLEFIPMSNAFNEDDVARLYQMYMMQGYEGAMYRNLDMGYENKRSVGLLKIKKMKEAEFKIVGINEGSGRLIGHVGSFELLTNDGKRFSAKLRGKTDYLKVLFERSDDLIGEVMTVTYQSLTPDGIPKFPVGKEIRDYE